MSYLNTYYFDSASGPIQVTCHSYNMLKITSHPIFINQEFNEDYDEEPIEAFDDSQKEIVSDLHSNVSKVSKLEDETFTCSICLESSEEMTKDWSKVDKCNHIFHTSCLQEWCQNNKTCPCCRHKLL
jgi:hypothetical protein